jgi:hypothetical protein
VRRRRGRAARPFDFEFGGRFAAADRRVRVAPPLPACARSGVAAGFGDAARLDDAALAPGFRRGGAAPCSDDTARGAGLGAA